MQKLLLNFANLIKVKTIVTFVVLTVFVVQSLQGRISSDDVMVVTMSVISFYFGTQHEKKE